MRQGHTEKEHANGAHEQAEAHYNHDDYLSTVHAPTPIRKSLTLVCPWIALKKAIPHGLLHTCQPADPIRHKQRIPTASAFGAIVVSDPLDTGQRLDAGRLWQRLHLAMTVDGVSAQPLCQIPERIDRERSAGLAPDFGPAFAALLPAGRHAIMTFRIGHPTTKALPSPRRPAREVVLS